MMKGTTPFPMTRWGWVSRVDWPVFTERDSATMTPGLTAQLAAGHGIDYEPARHIEFLTPPAVKRQWRPRNRQTDQL